MKAMQSTNITYRMEDGTGMIDVKQWIDAEQGAASVEYPYVCVHPVAHPMVVQTRMCASLAS
jgi:hypothetical protein